ncbi:MAG TPA: hypothetical protein PKI20_06870 [Verrucomicrobiota bacterium]|nr:hypothetical protein [Verrucomicrobiota bacterium]HQL78823.1 hypothetical protein [Verrucomicrobiota bacterium]
MNSLPLIPHHLFVAAIGNDGRAGQRPSRPEPRPGWRAGRAEEGALEVMDAGKPMPASTTRRSRASVNLASS